MFDFTRYPAFSALLIITLSVIACSPRHVSPPSSTIAQPTPTGRERDTPQVVTPEPPSYVKAIEVFLLESFPVQANVLVTVALPNSCKVVDGVTEERNDNTFKLELHISEQTKANCLPQSQSFEQIIPLDLANLTAGIYTVEVNGQSQEFELTMDNF
jgi:inhibitor of cysteine peptidase